MADDKPAKAASTRQSGMKIDSDLVRELAEMLSETGLTEIEVEDGDRKIRVSRAGSIAAAAPMAAPASPAPALAAPAGPRVAADDTPSGEKVRSPMVGTAYLSPEPGTDPYVKIGDKVAAGDTLIIVEAMKVMNAIPAPMAGTVRAILVDNGEAIEFDQPIAIIE